MSRHFAKAILPDIKGGNAGGGLYSASIAYSSVARVMSLVDTRCAVITDRRDAGRTKVASEASVMPMLTLRL